MSALAAPLGALTLKNPVIAASSELTMTEDGIRACIDAGAGAVVAKSVNESEAAARQLRSAAYALLDGDLQPRSWDQAEGHETLFNRSGLAPGGIDAWTTMLARCQRYAASNDSMVIGSITVGEADAAAELARAMAEVVPAIELNIGAPHGREAASITQVSDAGLTAEYVSAVRAAVSCPLIVKLPGQAGDLTAMAHAAVEHGADAITLIGRLNGFVPRLDDWSPELGTRGAVGGPWMLPTSLFWVNRCYLELDAHIPVIGTNGARSGRDVARFLLSGARAVELATLLLIRGPAALGEVIEELAGYLDEHDVTASELVGASARRTRAYADLPATEPVQRPWDAHLRDGADGHTRG